MAFDWEVFLDLAEVLVQQQGNPAAERSAISRAYYACFHGAAAFWRDRGERLTWTGDDHVLVWDLFLGPGGDRRSRWLGETGHRLRQARRRADYDATARASLSSEAQSWMRVARRFLSELAALR